MVLNTKTAIVTNCLKDRKCTTEIFRNKKLDIKTDVFGSIYYNKIENSGTSVILFKYYRGVPKGLQDGNYSEEVIFEINNSDKTITLKDADFQQTKMLLDGLFLAWINWKLQSRSGKVDFETRKQGN